MIPGCWRSHVRMLVVRSACSTHAYVAPAPLQAATFHGLAGGQPSTANCANCQTAVHTRNVVSRKLAYTSGPSFWAASTHRRRYRRQGSRSSLRTICCLEATSRTARRGFSRVPRPVEAGQAKRLVHGLPQGRRAPVPPVGLIIPDPAHHLLLLCRALPVVDCGLLHRQAKRTAPNQLNPACRLAGQCVQACIAHSPRLLQAGA